jgi:3-isopropylmalate dehydrogenase
MKPTIAVLPGDGVGPEVTAAAMSILQACAPVDLRAGLIGGAAIDATGDPLPGETLALCKESTAVFLGAVGGPKWDGSTVRPEAGLLGLRQYLGLHANLRPARYLGLPTPLRDGVVRHADILVVRDLAGGVYFGEPRGIREGVAVNTWIQTADQTRVVAEIAFRQARRRRKRVTSVDKANVLEASRLWRAVVSEVGRQYPDVELEHRYVDAMAFALVNSPQHFDVVLADNLFGDILSDEAGAISGSISVLPSASLGPGPSLFEPVHGAMPEVAGQGIANPVGAILTVALLLEHALKRPDLARVVEASVLTALKEVRTPDLGGRATTEELTAAVHRHLSWQRWAHDAEAEQAAPAEWGV